MKKCARNAVYAGRGAGGGTLRGLGKVEGKSEKILRMREEMLNEEIRWGNAAGAIHMETGAFL